MKKLLIVAALMLATFLPGCTLVEDCSERNRRICGITELQMKMAVEDWDYFWLYDHSTGMTQWHPWVGI